MKDLYNKKSKRQKEEIEQDTRRWRHIPCSHYCENHHTAGSHPLIQYNSHQNPNGILHGAKKLKLIYKSIEDLN